MNKAAWPNKNGALSLIESMVVVSILSLLITALNKIRFIVRPMVCRNRLAMAQFPEDTEHKKSDLSDSAFCSIRAGNESIQLVKNRSVQA